MTDANIPDPTQLGAALHQGVDTLDLFQQVTFDLYIRIVLPFDKYVFWLKASKVTPGALLNAVKQNDPTNTNPVVPALQIMAKGSLHYATDEHQEEDSSFAVNAVRFTSQQPVQDLNYVGPQLIYIASFDGVRFAFSSREMFYRQAELWHYQGHAIFSTMESQIIDDVAAFDQNQLIVSNSLPAWLAMQAYAPAWPVLIPFPNVAIYPSFASPANLAPPYITIHIEPEETAAIQSVPRLADNLSHDHLAKDRVVVTLYGLNNDAAMQFLDAALQYSFDNPNSIGLMNTPIVHDDKKTQTELLILAMKKRIVFEVSYHQASIRNIAQQHINSTLVTQLPQPGPPLLP